MHRALVIVCALVMVVPAHAQCNGAFSPGVPSPILRWGGNTGAGIFASTTWDPDGGGPLPPRLVIGGSMTTIGGQDTSSVAVFDGAQWFPMPLTGIPFALTTWNGDLVAAGNSFVRRWNASTWDALGTISGDVLAVQEFNGELYAGGGFNGFVLRLQGSTWQPLGPGLAPGLGRGVNSMTVHAGRLIVGGNSLQQNGDTTNAPAMAWDGAAWTPLAGNITNIRCVQVFGGDLIACGYPAAGGSNVVRWDGNAWQPMGSGVPLESVFRLVVTSQGLLAAGETDHRNSNPPTFSAGIYRWNGAQWDPLYAPTDPESLVTDSFTLAEYAGQLFWGGNITTAQGDSEGYMGLIRSSGQTFAPIFDGPSYSVRGLASYGDSLVAWGDFLAIGDIAARRIARVDTQGWHSIGGGIGGSSAYVSAATTYNGELFVTGSFSSLGPYFTSTNFGAWNGSAWRPISGGPFGGPSSPSGLIVLGPDLLAYGNFFSIGTIGSTTSSPYLARYNGAAWSPFPLAPASPVLAAAIFNNQLIIAENSLAAHHGLARWDGAAWQQLGAGLNGVANALTTYNGQLIAAGAFTTAGGQSASRVARWDGAAWQPLGPGLNAAVTALAVYNNELYAAGAFTASGALTSLGGLARWNGSQWARVDTGVSGSGYYDGINTSGAPLAMAPLNNDLIIAGHFKNAGQYHSPYLARWTTHCCGSADFNHDGDTATDADIEAFFACIAGNCCATCDSADFNGDGDSGTDADIEAFFRVLAGGAC
jgi:hypothetical protein